MKMRDELGNCQVHLPSSWFRFNLATWQLGLYNLAAYQVGRPRLYLAVAKLGCQVRRFRPNTMRES